MLLFAVPLLVLLSGNEIFGIDLNSAIPRTNCYRNEQPNCNEEFIEVYQNLSKSATGLTDASTWFLLFTRNNPEEPEKLHKCGGKLPPNSNFNPNNRLIVNLVSFVVGYCDIAGFRELTTQFLEREDCNVLVVDYAWGNHIEVTEAYVNIEIVADQTAIVLQNIQKETGIRKEQIYVVGLSLGGQLAGLIGYRFPVGRITAFDPGNQIYDEDMPLKYRLDRTDADLVDIWHTNMGDCLPNFGINYDAGDIDFYINGGRVQKTCPAYAYTSILKGDILYGFGTAIYPQLCWHTMSMQYFKVSINPGNCQFVAVKCSSYEKFLAGGCRSCGSDGSQCTIMGYDLDKYYTNNATEFPQRYYYDTSLKCPWCDNSKIQLDGFASTYRSSLQSDESTQGIL